MGEARYGRRDNGLVASEYAAAGDVDPRVGEYILKLLAKEGIAAYLRPSSDLYSVTRSTILPKRPTDRLFVDRDHVATARDHLARLAREEREAEEAGRTPAATGPDQQPGDGGTSMPAGAEMRAEPSAEEVDRAFAQIIAGLSASAGSEAPVSPARPVDPGRLDQDRYGGRPRRETTWPEQPSGRAEADEEGSLLDGLDTFGADLPGDEPEEFVPPEPPPVPRPSLPTALGVIGVVGGLALFLKPDLLSFLSESLAMFLGFAGVVAGSATLVWRLRPGSDEDDVDPDNGARV